MKLLFTILSLFAIISCGKTKYRTASYKSTIVCTLTYKDIIKHSKRLYTADVYISCPHYEDAAVIEKVEFTKKPKDEDRLVVLTPKLLPELPRLDGRDNEKMADY